MSQDFWNVEGYGIEIDEDKLDLEKILTLSIFDLEDKDIIRDEYRIHKSIIEVIEDSGLQLHDFIHAITESTPLSFGDTADIDAGKYLMYYSKKPWEMNGYEKSLTREDMDNIIIKVLRPYLKDEYDEVWIKDNIDDISYNGAA